MDVFNALLVERASAPKKPPTEVSPSRALLRGSHADLNAMIAALDAGESIIFFPEGTRGSGMALGAFKSGLFHLARMRPTVPLVPVRLENLSRMLPKGEFLPIPLLGSVTFGPSLLLAEGETKDAFLTRARAALEALAE